MTDEKPSQVTDVYWLVCGRMDGEYPGVTQRNGKWLVFIYRDEIDEWWEKIRAATEEGRLGSASKVSTAKPNPLSREPNKHVICVYTYDYKDREDVKRIRDELRTLGVTWKIPYKADVDTLRGKYRVTGHERISKYYE